MNVLIADDDDILRSMTADILISQGLFDEENVIQAVNGVEAFEKVEKEHPDIIIMDMMMPMMNGAELIEKVRDSDNDPEIVIMTGYADLDMAVNVIGMGVSEMLRKPFKPLELVHILDKIMQKLKLEEENSEIRDKLYQSDRLSSIGLMAAGVAHEINNPNTFVMGNMDLLLKYWGIIKPIIAESILRESPDQKKHTIVYEKMEGVIQSAKDGSDRIRKIVSGLLSFCRSQSSVIGNVGIAEVIDNAVAMTSHYVRRYKLNLSVPQDVSQVYVNEQDVLQVIMNLLVNAVDAIDEKYQGGVGGELTVEVKATAEDDFILLVIRDNGIGMEKEVISKMYDPFFTTKDQGKGTGLGMSISLGNITRSGGTIECDSRPGEGTEFILRLPVKAIECEEVAV